MTTKGEYRTGISCNPSGDDLVARIKRASADLIDLIETIPSDRDSAVGNERGRLKALAQTEIESAAMWAVKAATKTADGAIPTNTERLQIDGDPFAAAVKRALTAYRRDEDKIPVGATEFVRGELAKAGFLAVSNDDIDEAIVAAGRVA